MPPLKKVAPTLGLDMCIGSKLTGLQHWRCIADAPLKNKDMRSQNEPNNAIKAAYEASPLSEEACYYCQRMPR